MKKYNVTKKPEWVSRGKSIQQLINELQSFEDKSMEVRVSIDDGDTFSSISLVTKENEKGVIFCGIANSESENG